MWPSFTTVLHRLHRLCAPPPLPAGIAPDGPASIAAVGHRDYVGGLWEEIGQLQFQFLLQHGLQPSHVLLDIACGSLRGGVHVIPYLDKGHYLGIDRERSLIALGIAHELGQALYDAKQPEFVVSKRFAFQRFSKRPDVSIAQSLFTHLTLPDIRRCLRNLRRFVHAGHCCYATFFVGDSANNLPRSHSHHAFTYPTATLLYLGQQTGWHGTYLGDWQHPRGQHMLRYTAD